MKHITFDTLLYTKKLREAGCPEAQAEIQAEALKDIVDNNLTTKDDIKNDFAELRTEFTDLRSEFTVLRTEFEKLEYRLTAKFGTMMAVGIGILAALIKL